MENFEAQNTKSDIQVCYVFPLANRQSNLPQQHSREANRIAQNGCKAKNTFFLQCFQQSTAFSCIATSRGWISWAHLLCGWMYWIKRYMKVFKDFVCQKVHAEGSIAEGYSMSQAMYFIQVCGEGKPKGLYAFSSWRWFTHHRRCLIEGSKSKEDECVYRKEAFRFVLGNKACLQPWWDKHHQEPNENPNLPFWHWAQKLMQDAISNGDVLVDRMVENFFGQADVYARFVLG